MVQKFVIVFVRYIFTILFDTTLLHNGVLCPYTSSSSWLINDLNSSTESGSKSILLSSKSILLSSKSILLSSKSILLSLDISAAFDTIDTHKLLQRLVSDFGIGGSASTWLRSYLTGRSCYVAMGDHKSDVWSCDSGVPQGSVLGPILFSAFVSPISRIMEAHGIKYHQYANDTQLYTEVRSLDSTQMEALSKCVSALTFWFLDNGLQLNSSKTEAMIFGTRPGLSKLGQFPSWSAEADVAVEESIKILLSMDNQVKASIKACNYHISALRHVRRGPTLESAKLIALGLVTSRLDYYNSLLYGTS